MAEGEKREVNAELFTYRGFHESQYRPSVRRRAHGYARRVNDDELVSAIRQNSDLDDRDGCDDMLDQLPAVYADLVSTEPVH